MRVAIVGAGSIGSIVGAFINKAGIQADLIDVYQDNIDALNENGVTITGTYDMNVPVKAYHIGSYNNCT